MNLGLYVNRHGSGHARRVREIVKHFNSSINVIIFLEKSKASFFNDLKNIKVTTLEDKIITELINYFESDSTDRNTKWHEIIQEYKLNLMHIDVDTEVAKLCQELGIPYTYTLMHGDRYNVDLEMIALNSAKLLLAPYPEIINDPNVPELWGSKTFYSGFISSRSNNIFKDTRSPNTNIVLFIVGEGFMSGYKNLLDLDFIAQLATHFPQFEFQVCSKSENEPFKKANLNYLGFRADTQEYIDKAEIVIGTAGYGIVAEMVQNNKKYVAVPAHTPHNEQLLKAQLLEQAGYIKTIFDIHNIDEWKTAFAEVKFCSPLQEIYAQNSAYNSAKQLEKLIQTL